MRIKYIIYSILFALLLTNCNKEEINNPTKARTVLVYMAADNSLGKDGFDSQNIKAMLEGAEEKGLNGGNLIVYRDSRDTIPQLIQITAQGKKIIKEYPKHQNSASIQAMQEAISDTKTTFPANSYGLILWSHGSNWFPSGMELRAFGQDKNNWMELSDLKAAIPDATFDFIIFDACYMGGIEVAYELREKADYIIAAPTEILGSGMPYKDISSQLFANPLSLPAICDAFYDYYAESSATIALIYTPALETLADATRNVMLTSFDKTEDIQLNSLQRYFRGSYYGMYDFDDYISRITSNEPYAQFQSALENVVIHKKNTKNFLIAYGGFKIEHFCGLSSFIIKKNNNAINQKYMDLDWYKAVYK